MTESLLTIDVSAEIRKLTEARFRSPGEYAVELCRHTLAADPEELEIDISWRRLSIHADRTTIAAAALDQLIVLFDSTATLSARHEALLALEGAGHRSLLALFSIPSAKVIIDAEIDGRPVAAVFKGRAFRRWKPRRPGNPGFTVISMARQPLAEERLLRSALRYCRRPWRLNGRPMTGTEQLNDCFYQVEIENNRLHGYIALPKSGNLVRITRLKNGVVEQELLRPAHRGFVVHCVVEERDDRLDQTLETLERSSATLYRKAAASFDRFGREDRERLRVLSIEAARRSGDHSLLEGFPLFQAVRRAPLTLEDVRHFSAAKCLYAVDETTRVPDLRCKGRVILRLNSADRQFLDTVPGIGIRLLPAAVQDSGRTMALRFQEFQREFIRLFKIIVRRGRIADGQTDAQMNFAEAVRAAVKSLPENERDIRLSFDDALARHMAERVGADATLLGAALLVLTDGDDRVL